MQVTVRSTLQALGYITVLPHPPKERKTVLERILATSFVTGEFTDSVQVALQQLKNGSSPSILEMNT